MPIPAILGAAASAAGSAIGGSAIGSSILGGLSSAGSFLSGLGSVFGGGKAKRGPSFTDQLGMNDQFIRHDLDSRLRAAKDFGVHPLLMLGQTSSLQPVGSFGTESSPNAADIASGFGNGVNRAVEAWSTREDRDFARTTAALQVENMHLQNDRLRSEIALMQSPGSPPGISAQPFMPGQANPSVPPEFYKALPTPLGIGSNVPLSINTIDGNGQVLPVMNPDAGDNELLMLAHGLGVTLQAYIRNQLKGLLKKRTGSPAQHVFKH